MFRKFQAFVTRVVLQKFLVPVLLTLVYFLVFGPGCLLFKAFGRRWTRPKYLEEGSFWITAEGYSPDPKRSLQQS